MEEEAQGLKPKTKRVSREEKAKALLLSKGYQVSGEGKKTKAKRKPSAWNLAVKEAFVELKKRDKKATLAQAIQMAKTKRGK